MANSGTVLGNHVNISGARGARVRVEWQLAGQNVGGNYSIINWQGYVDFDGADAQLDNGHVRTSVGDVYNNGGRVYNYSGNFSNHTIGMGSGQFTIGHDGNGNQNLYMQGDVAVYQSGTSNGSGTWGLPQINQPPPPPQYATITQFYIDAVTDTSLRFNWAADVNCDYVSWWSNAYDGGGHHDIPVGGAGLFQITLPNLISDKDYDVTVAVRRASSGLWTSSGTISARTLVQNNFMMFL